MVSPQAGQAVGVHDAEDFGIAVLPADVVFVATVRQQLIDVIPQEPAV